MCVWVSGGVIGGRGGPRCFLNGRPHGDYQKLKWKPKEKFYDAEDKDQSSPEVNEEIPAAVLQSSAQQKEQGTSGVDPSCPTGRNPEAELLKFQAEFERKRANRFHADLEKARRECETSALLHKPDSNPILRFLFHRNNFFCFYTKPVEILLDFC
ncbi:hypothetical protein Dimus_020650 [Dionaea muscipula]